MLTKKLIKCDSEGMAEDSEMLLGMGEVDTKDVVQSDEQVYEGDPKKPGDFRPVEARDQKYTPKPPIRKIITPDSSRQPVVAGSKPK